MSRTRGALAAVMYVGLFSVAPVGDCGCGFAGAAAMATAKAHKPIIAGSMVVMSASSRDTRFIQISLPGLVDAETSGTEQPQQTDDDQIQGNNVVEQLGHDKNKYASEKGDQWANTQIKIHVFSLIVERGGRRRCHTIGKSKNPNVRLPGILLMQTA